MASPISMDGTIMAHFDFHDVSDHFTLADDRFGTDCCCGNLSDCQKCCFDPVNGICCYSYKVDPNTHKTIGLQIRDLIYHDKLTWDGQFVGTEEVLVAQVGDQFIMDSSCSSFQMHVHRQHWTDDVLDLDIPSDFVVFNSVPRTFCSSSDWKPQDNGVVTGIERFFFSDIAAFCTPRTKKERNEQADVSRETHGLSCRGCCDGWDESFSASARSPLSGVGFQRDFSFSYTIVNTVKPCDKSCSKCLP